MRVIVVESTEILRAVVEEFGGAGPFYDTLYYHLESIRSISILYSSLRQYDAAPDAAWERCARNALLFFHDSDEIGIMPSIITGPMWNELGGGALFC